MLHFILKCSKIVSVSGSAQDPVGGAYMQRSGKLSWEGLIIMTIFANAFSITMAAHFAIYLN